MAEMTHKGVDNLKPKKALYYQKVRRNLYIAVAPSGRKTWYYRYTFLKKPDTMKIPNSAFPGMSLIQAQAKRDAYDDLIERGINPKEWTKKKKEEEVSEFNKQTTFSQAFDSWHDHMLSNWSPRYAKKVKQAIQNNVLPKIGKMLVTDIKPLHIYSVLDYIERKGGKKDNAREYDYVETRVKCLGWIEKIFKRCIKFELIDFSPSASIDTSEYKKRNAKSMATTVKPTGIREILIKIDNHFSVLDSWQLTLATQISPYLMARPGELAGLEWSEIDFEEKLITIPKERMKMKKDHLMPMSDQVIKILEEALEKKRSAWVFPGLRRNDYISVEGLEQRLVACGIARSELTPHGWRSMGSTRLNEGISKDGSTDSKNNSRRKGEHFDQDEVEKQLSHRDKSMRGTYNDAAYVEDRRYMMQKWADWLDTIRHPGADPVENLTFDPS